MEENMNTHQLLRDAALKGDVTILRILVAQDPFLLHTSSKIKPLHISSKLGHLEFTAELLHLNPSLAEEDPTDKSSPLHLASGHGHVDVVKALVSTNAGLCLARDAHGRNPAHVAAIKGHVLVLEELIRAVPAVSRERVGGGREGILHLCVKYNQLEALKTVIEKATGDIRMLLNAKDGDGNTILHIAMVDKRVEILRFLLSDPRVEQNVENEYGWTIKDILKENEYGWTIKDILKGKKKNAKTMNTQMSVTINRARAKLLTSNEIKKKNEKLKLTSWFNDQRNALMIVASVVATMAFQAGLTPPFKYEEGHPRPSRRHYMTFVIVNTIGMVSSMSSLILLISGLPGRRFFVVLVMLMMWLAVSSMTYTYGVSIQTSIPELEFAFNHTSDQKPFLHTKNTLSQASSTAIGIWANVMALILLWHLVVCTLKGAIRCFGCLGRNTIQRYTLCFEK